VIEPGHRQELAVERVSAVEHRNNPGTTLRLLRELDVGQVKETVVTEELFGGSIEINAGCEATIVEDADTPTPLIEFQEYREEPILVRLDLGNLAKAQAPPPQNLSP
jgi:hypothetical protein